MSLHERPYDAGPTMACLPGRWASMATLREAG
jgi:hypothetical protein